MKVEGVRELPAPREQVWSLLMDPEVLCRCLPGCEKLEREPDGSYRASISLGVAAIKGAYAGVVRMSDVDPPRGYTLALEGKGTPGFVRGTARIDLADKGDTTSLTYSGEVAVGGLIASIGQRMIDGMARTLLDTFFQSVEKEIRSTKGT